MTVSLQIPIGQAAYPVPFTPGLEFNSPAHGVWNIVHVGMLVPQVHQIYVCAINCMRGVILTAAEMNASDRFSFVILREEDLLEGTVEDITIEGVADVLEKLPNRPPAVMLFTVCLHRFLGSDLDRIFGELARRFPDIDFIRASMEPITQKGGLSPDQRLRKGMYDPLRPLPVVENKACILGGDFPLEPQSELKRLLAENGCTVQEIHDCHTYEEYLEMGSAAVYLSVYPKAAYGAAETAKRLGRPHCHLPASFDYDEITAELDELAALLHLPRRDWCDSRQACEAAVSHARSLLGGTPIVLDQTAHPRPLGMARYLLTHGFRVETVYLDAVSPAERDDFMYLQENFPDLMLAAVNQPGCRVEPRRSRRKTLAIGQIAAWRRSTPHFVNMVEGAGLWGFAGIATLAAWMEDAFLHEKDTEDLVPRKGLGCESCV